ncbi:MAG: amidase [Acidobacteriaceae bacterium]|nr:amidase [Acidobacteriaceae bacterium]
MNQKDDNSGRTFKDGSGESGSQEQPSAGKEVNRRAFLGAGSLGAAAFATLGRAADVSPDTSQSSDAVASNLEEATIADLQAAMSAGRLTAAGLVQQYLSRINKLDRHGPEVNSVLELNPDALAIAKVLDQERRLIGVRGPLHGIPVMLKGNIDTADKMQTTAGSLALIGPSPSTDATVAARLRAAGAVILGKTNLSEWANFRSTRSTSGWSGVGAQTNNPYFLDRNPSGSSSGSAAAVSSNFCVAGLGTETDGSIVSPANSCGVAAIKPTVGLTSRAGVVPISHNQDTVGPHCRTVTDAAIVLGALVGVDSRDPATAASSGKFYTDYTRFLNPNGLQGARIGVLRKYVTGYSYFTDAIFEAALQTLRDAGATLVDPADPPSADEINSNSPEFTVLLYDFKADVNAYLATRTGLSVHTLADLIAFNNSHAAQEMPYFKQEIFELAEATTNLTDPVYLDALARNHSLSREQGIDAVLQQYNLDALVAPTGSPAWPTDLINSDHFIGASSFYAAMAGYPIVNVPAGFAFGLPVGLSFMGTAFSEPVLIRLAYAFEQATKVRQAPKFVPILKLGGPITDAAANAAQAMPLPSSADTNSGSAQSNSSYRPRLI